MKDEIESQIRIIQKLRDAAKKRKMRKDDDKMERTNLYLPRSLKKAARKLAMKEIETDNLSAYIRFLIHEKLNKA